MDYRAKLDNKRIEEGYSIANLADAAGMGVTSVSRIVNGRVKPHPRTIHKLTQALECSASEIGFDTDREVSN